jgi:hypothetical protein
VLKFTKEKQKQKNRISHQKAFEQQRKQELKGNLYNGRRYFQTTYLVRGYYPKYIRNINNSIAIKQIT